MYSLTGQIIIFLPGMDGTGISFEPFRRVLPQNIEIKVIQYPTNELLSFEETVQCAKEQIPYNHEEVIVIAESFSGPVAIALVGSGQLKAKCLILCSTFARSPRPVLLKLLNCFPLELFLKIPFPGVLFKYIIEGGEETAKIFLDMWQRIKVLVPAKVLVHRLNIINQVNVLECLPKIKIPCCYMQATSDRSVPASSLSDFVELIPDLKVVKIKGPHFILQAKPQASLFAILNFLDQMTKQASTYEPVISK